MVYTTILEPLHLLKPVPLATPLSYNQKVDTALYSNWPFILTHSCLNTCSHCNSRLIILHIFLKCPQYFNIRRSLNLPNKPLLTLSFFLKSLLPSLSLPIFSQKSSHIPSTVPLARNAVHGTGQWRNWLIGTLSVTRPPSTKVKYNYLQNALKIRREITTCTNDKLFASSWVLLSTVRSSNC